MESDSVVTSYWFNHYPPLDYGHIDWENMIEYKGSEMVISRWLETLHMLIKEYDLAIDVKLIRSDQNKAH